MTETQKALNKFRDTIINEAKANLKSMGKDSTGKLSKSIKGQVKQMPNSISMYFQMEEYGFFQDQGVRGVGGVRSTTSKFKRTNNKGKIWKQNGAGSPFSFKVGKKPSPKHFEKWAKQKGLNAFAVSNAVYHQGIKRSLFFTKPFEKAFKNLPDALITKYGLDAEELFDSIMNETLTKK